MSSGSRDPNNSPVPQRQVSAIAANLAEWAAQPVKAINRRAVLWTGISMAFVVFASRHDPQQASFARNVAMIFISVHGLLYIMLQRTLTWLRDRGMVEAGLALRAYTAPRRITNLDLAIAWAAFAAIISLTRVLLARLYGS